MRALFNFLSGLYLFYLFFLLIGWYIKGHFGKYFILFWACTIFSICFWYYKTEQYKAQYDSRSGQEIWNENMKNYNPVRGY